MKIVIVDDSGLTRKMITKLIRSAGINNEIIEADNGKSALELIGINLKDIGIVFSDWNMPVMSGIEFIEAMAKNPQTADIPIFISSTEATEERLKLAQNVNSSVAGCLMKPFTPEQVKEKISPILSRL
ncbi:MAG: response regulator [Candidatus Omnitrophica bacterium]|nr:response regulator [Candidatus Omnitrophota bacterium]